MIKTNLRGYYMLLSNGGGNKAEWLLTEDGEPIMTEDGDVILIEG